METDSDIDEMMMTQKIEPKFDEILYDLETKKINLINEFNYLEADKIQIRIEKIQKKKALKERKDLELLHYNELKSLEEKFTFEMEALVEEFNKRFQELELASKSWEEDVDKKHKQEVVDLTKQINELTMIKFKCNKEYIDLMKTEELLVKTLKFKEAHVVKVKREKLQKQHDEETKKQDLTQTPKQKNRYQLDKLEKRHKNEREMLNIRIEREIEKIKKDKSTTLEQLHFKFKNRKLNLEYGYKKEISLNANPVRAKSSHFKIPKMKNTSGVFPKFSNIDNYSVHNTLNTRSNNSNKNIGFQTEKINVNLSNIPKNINDSKNPKNDEKQHDDDNMEQLNDGDFNENINLHENIIISKQNTNGNDKIKVTGENKAN